MHVLTTLILIVLKILIAIGDFVQYLFKELIKLVKKFFQTVAAVGKNVTKHLQIKTSYPTRARVGRPRKITNNQPVFSFAPFFKKISATRITLPKRKIRPTYSFHKQKKVKEVRIFPLPIFSKLKYFIGGTVFSFFFIFIPLLSFIFLQNLPNPNQLTNSDTQQTTKLYDRNGTLLYQIYATQNRTLVPLSQIPKNLQEATIAIEDKNFYKSPGFDLGGIARSALADISGKPIQGGSTITQQLIKSTLLTSEVSIDRKIKEIILAFWAGKIYSKNQILQLYLNQVPYGGTAWGVEAASQTYFGKHVNELDLAQSAFLAGLPQEPSTYSPYGDHPDLWKKRQHDVLKAMQQQKYITKDQELAADDEQLSFQPAETPIHAPHFVMYVKNLLIKKYGLPFVERGGLTVITSLDLKTQDMAQKIVTDEVNNDAYLHLTNAAALVTNPKNGDILAMVGSKDYDDPSSGAVNLTTSLRQPGSSIKVVTYSAALSHGFTAATILDDSPVNYNGYSPVNYDGKFHGRIPLRFALANSFNIPAVKTLNQIGIPTMIDQAKAMGITTFNDPSRYGLSITLGGVEVKMVD
ncbi:MAG: transglycosylase domain-containing protein, partial [Candidatus Paceibacterales bacterium]